jgi:hypothetical protein
MADRTSARRAGANSFFLTLNTALTAVVGIISSARKPAPNGSALPSFDPFGLVVTAIAGIVLAFVWWLLLRYYRRLNGAKFDVITRLEQRLPAQPYTDEWTILHPGESAPAEAQSPPSRKRTLRDRVRRWPRRVKHREASLVEQVVPFVFMGIYATLAVRVLVQ